MINERDIEEIYAIVSRLSGVKARSKASRCAAVLKGVQFLEAQRRKALEKTERQRDQRIQQVVNVLMAYAKLDFTEKASISDANDDVDALASGINMLGEELQASTISLHEKEVLLKEIHHRVKNNLQVISSLLSLQSSYIKDPASREHYLISRDRVKSMALVHEKLYLSKDLSRIDFCDYVRSLSRSLDSGYNPDHERIRLELELDKTPVFFKVDTAIPCGLILNELISNCYKYAFSDGREGVIRVQLRKGKNDYLLEVADNGKGLPKKLKPRATSTLGLQLVYMLAEQLEAKVKVERENGTSFRFRFSREIS